MIKVMIVDDEPFIRQGLGILINWEQYGFEISGEASNGKEALDILKEKDFDLIITDIKMPQMDGIELIGHIRQNTPNDIQFIILSGFYEFEYAKKAIKYVVVDYVLKPVQREELIRALEDYKVQFSQKAEERKKQEISDKILFSGYLMHLICGIQKEEEYAYILRYLADHIEARYIILEYDPMDDKFHNLSNQEKLKAQNLLYDSLKDYLNEHWYHALIDSNSGDNEYAVGFIYVKKLAELAGASEKEYIQDLYQKINSMLNNKIILYIGQMVEDISLIQDSYKSARIAKSFQQLSNGSEISYYDEIKSNTNTLKYPVNKYMMDGLIRAVEENDEVAIDKQIEAVYSHFKDWVTEPEIIKINLDYLLFNLINLAKELDPEFDQDEVYKMISQSGYGQMAVRGSVKHFREFALDFASYLSQLRQHTFSGVLNEIEKEITEHYMDYLSLKSLSEKYFINSAYLGQIFKKQYGIAFKDYLNNYRIDRAAEMLIRTDDKIYLVANTVGFNNTDYFISKFVQLKGITPLQYRKQFVKR